MWYEDLRIRKKEAAKAAKELHYPVSVIRKIESAKNEYEINRILADARKTFID